MKELTLTARNMSEKRTIRLNSEGADIAELAKATHMELTLIDKSHFTINKLKIII